MQHLVDRFECIQDEIVGSEEQLVKLVERMHTGGFGANIQNWLNGENGDECFFELQTAGNDNYKDIELLASKIYNQGVIMILVYYQNSYYVILQEGEGPNGGQGHSLLDSKFPDISTKARGFQIQTYPEGLKAFPELRKLHLWQAAAPHQTNIAAEAKNTPEQGTTQNEREGCKAEVKRVEDTSSDSPAAASPSDATSKQESGSDPDRKQPQLSPTRVSLPHHIPPMKHRTMPGLSGVKSGEPSAPWDKNGKPLVLGFKKLNEL